MIGVMQRAAATLLPGVTLPALPAADAGRDPPIRGARLIDPESGLNAIRDVAGGARVTDADPGRAYPGDAYPANAIREQLPGTARTGDILIGPTGR